jgi:hypothetical protein
MTRPNSQISTTCSRMVEEIAKSTRTRCLPRYAITALAVEISPS